MAFSPPTHLKDIDTIYHSNKVPNGETNFDGSFIYSVLKNCLNPQKLSQ